MPTPIAMPSLGMTMREGTVVEWRTRVGDRVEKGEVLLLIESEKAEVEIEAPATGFVRALLVAPGATVPCGTVLALLTASPDEAFDPAAFAAPQAPRAEAGPRPGALATPRPAAAEAPATPAARKLAKEHGLDLARLRGSGPGGRITREDVEAVLERLASRVPVREGLALERPVVGDGPPVLLLPGFGTDLTVYARQIPALSSRFRVMALNPRGVGLSDAPESERYAVPEAADDAATAAGEPVHVVGASLGAAVALSLAQRHPERVRSLVLVTPFQRASGRLRAVIEAWTALAAAVAPEILARAIVPWLFAPATLEDDGRRARLVRGFAETAARVSAATLERAAAGLRDWGIPDTELRRISVPTTVLAAEQDLLTPDSAALAAALPRARLVTLRGTGHGCLLEDPEAANEALLAHLAASTT
jgi:pyruvate dehydrogenase E2 component (dihydrolipoamide acetyltransferase)